MLVSVAQAQMFFLALTRIMAMIIHVPVLGGQSIPTQVRIGFGLVLTAIIIPWQPLPAGAEALSLFGMAAAVTKEIILGTLAGFAAMITFGTVQIATEAMGLGSGFSSGRIFNPTMSESGSAYNQFFVMIAMLYFLVINGHHTFLLALQKTFEVVPINGVLPLDTFDTVAKMTAQLIGSGIHLALPVMAALLLTDFTLGLLAKAAPQVQVFFLGLPLKVGVSLFAMGLLFMVVFPGLANLYQAIGPRMMLLLGL